MGNFVDSSPTGSPVHDHGTVAELVLLIADLFCLTIGLHGHVTESILALREQTQQVKDPNGVGVAHVGVLLADELNIHGLTALCWFSGQFNELAQRSGQQSNV